MNKIYKYILAAGALVFAAASCVQEEGFKPGEPEEDGCYGVYFPSQQTNLVLDPAEPTVYKIKAARDLTNGDIVVPFEFEASDSSVFFVSELKFSDGQSESEITVDFSKSEVGVKYTCSFKITDTKYAKKYSSNAVALDLSIVREKWLELGNVSVYEDYYWGIAIPSSDQSAAVIYQNDVDRNLFRMENPFAKKYPGSFKNGDEWFVFRVLQPGDVLFKGDSDYETKITRRDLVYFDDFNTGFINTSYNAQIYLCHPSGFNSMKQNQDLWIYSSVLQYQPDGVTPGVVSIGPMYYMMGIGGWNGSESTSFKIVFPGFVETDYSIEMVAGLTEEGVVPVSFSLGTDVAKVRYKVYEGRLNTAQVQKFSAAVADGSEEGTSEFSAENDVLNISLDKTGVYTIVAATLDAEGNGKEAATAEFTYLASADEGDYAVVVSCGLELTDAYKEEGLDKRNSCRYYIYGDNLTEVGYGIFPLAYVRENGVDACLEDMDWADEDALSTINDSVLIDMFTDLQPNSDYVLVVYASNGYAYDYGYSVITTEGLPLELLGYASWTSSMWNVPDGYVTDVTHDPNYADEYRVGFDENWFYCTIEDKEKRIANVPLQIMAAYDETSDIYIIESADLLEILGSDNSAQALSSWNEAKDALTLEVAYILLNKDGSLKGKFGYMQEVFAKYSEEAAAASCLKGLDDIMSGKATFVKAEKKIRFDIPQHCYAYEYEPKTAEYKAEAAKSVVKRGHSVCEKDFDATLIK